jgi:tRNA A37 threonylcarbamoyladenosine dehydratase
MSSILDRTTLLLGETNLHAIEGARVAVFGLGGVGGTAAEALVRSAIGHLTLIDCDAVDPSNLNRQILFNETSIGERKTLAAQAHLSAINPQCDLALIDEAVDASFFGHHDFTGFSYLVDAIDDIAGKMAIAQYAISHKIPFISCLGMANRLDPSKVQVALLSETENDPLAKKIRSLYRKANIDLTKVPVIWSKETPVCRGITPASLMMVPSEAGLLIDSVVISSLVKFPKEV